MCMMRALQLRCCYVVTKHALRCFFCLKTKDMHFSAPAPGIRSRYTQYQNLALALYSACNLLPRPTMTHIPTIYHPPIPRISTRHISPPRSWRSDSRPHPALACCQVATRADAIGQSLSIDICLYGDDAWWMMLDHVHLWDFRLGV